MCAANSQNRRYEIQNAIIGEGSFGKVKVALDVSEKRRVAVKILNKKDLELMGIEDYIRREIKIHNALDHKHIVKLNHVVETQTKLYIFMEFADQGNLEEYLEINGPMDEQQAKQVFKELLSAVEYLHTQHYVMHRDLQLSNICLDKNGHAKLIDFGIADYFSPDEKNGNTFCGHSSYMAPEMISGQKYGPEVDIWSLGVCLFKLVSGYFPFRAGDMSRHEFAIPLDDEMISDECKDFLKRILVANPQERPTCKELWKHPWLQ